MFELLAFLAVVVVGGIIVGALFLVLSMVKFAFKVALVPLKLLWLPLAAVFFIVKFAVVAALGATVVAVAIAVVVPIIVMIALLAIPVAIIGALT
jgi:hypothetical protein